MVTNHILAVDDDPKMLRLMRRGLSFAGYAVELAPDCEEALALARDNPPDLAVLDVMLPGLDGVEVCRRLRAGHLYYRVVWGGKGGLPVPGCTALIEFGSRT